MSDNEYDDQPDDQPDDQRGEFPRPGDVDTDAILSRRKLLIASALAVVGSAVGASACVCLSPRPCLTVGPVPPEASDAGAPPPPPPPPAKRPTDKRTGDQAPPKRKPPRKPAGRICLSPID